MKKLFCILFTFAYFAAIAGEVKVTSVTAQQRYPWNGLVDVTVTLQGTAEDIAEAEWSFAATNSATKAALSTEHITQNGVDTGSGTTWIRKFIWDAKADVGAVRIEDVALTVDAKVTDCAQLWENGPYWAKCNVGASKPEEYGYYFWWGDTVGYTRDGGTWTGGWYHNYSGVTWVSSSGQRMSSIPFSSSTCPTYGKSDSELQSLGYIDSTGNLVAKYDAATAHLGAPWRLPTDAEFAALLNNCDTQWTTRNGVYGRLVTGRSAYASKSIFLPAAGAGSGSFLYNPDSLGSCWSSTPLSDDSSYAWYLYFDSDSIHRGYYDRCDGRSVRPVRGFADIGSNGVGANAVSRQLSLDCREGLKDIQPEGVKLRYDASWYEGADSIRVLCNGVVIADGVSGDIMWNPDPNRSLYQLELKVMKNGEVVAAESVAMGPGYIRNVTARQLWLHNKVEISYEVADDIDEAVEEDAELVVSCDAGSSTTTTITETPTIVNTSGYKWTQSGTQWQSGGKGVQNLSTSSITASVSDATKISFRWKVSSESSYDFLHFYVDNTEVVSKISGSTDWTTVTYNLSSGAHTLKWAYTKDGSQDSGSDCGWVDSIQVTKMVVRSTDTACTLIGDTSAKPGLHRVVWDMEADGVSINKSDVRFKVGYGESQQGAPTQGGLVHRWSFNGDLTDSVGGQTATAVGSVTSDGSLYRLAGGSNGSSYISLGSNILPVDTGATTIEIWATRNQIRNWARVIDIGSSTANYLIWAWNNSTYSYDNVDYNNAVNVKTGTIDDNREYCFVIRIEDQGSGDGLMMCSKYDAQTGGLVDDVVQIQMPNWPLSKIGQTSCFLGHSRWSSDNDASSSYNEVRIWDYALSDAEVAKHLKLGPDALPSSVVAGVANGLSASIEVNTSVSSGTPLTVSNSAELGFSPIDTGLATIVIDGESLLSSTNSGSFAWQPKTTGEHTLEHLAGTNHWTRTVNVTSLAFAESPTPNPPTAADTNIKLGATARSVVAAGGTVSITTSGSGTWNATTSADWITFNGASSKAAGQSCIVRVAANTGVEPRVGYVYVSGHVYTITQAGVGAELEAYAAEFGAEGGEGEVLVLADGQASWNVKPESEWISVRETSGTGEAYVRFMVAPYAGVSDRTGYITIAGRTYEVHQVGRELSISRLKDEFDYASHVVEIDVTAFSSTEWYVTPFGSWISVVAPVEGLSHGSGKVMLAVNENPSYLSRSGSVMIGTERYEVTQVGRPPEVLAFAISPERTTASVNGANGLIAVSATPDLPWTATSQANWLTVMPTFREGAGDGNVVYTATPNSTMAERTGTIVVSAVAASGKGSKTHTVVQPAAVAAIADEDHVFAAEGDSFELEVTVDDNVNWAISGAPGVSALPSWVKVDGTLNRIGPGKVKIAVSENQEVDGRTATITVAGHAFTIVQRGRTVEVEYVSRVFDAEGGDGTIEVHPNGTVNWTAVSSAWWLTIWAEDGSRDNPDGSVSGSSDGTIGYYVDPYIGDGEALTATITIGDKVVYITQRAYDASISPSSATVGGNAGAGEFGFSASIDDVWTALDILCSKDWITTAQVTAFNAATKSGTIRYTYTANDSGVPRTGTIVVAGEAYQLTQSARRVARIEVEVEGGGSCEIRNAAGTTVGRAILGAPSSAELDVGESIILVATPAEGWEFVGWYVGEALVEGGAAGVRALPVTVSVAKKYTAKFAAIPTYVVNGQVVRRGTVVSCAAPADRIDDAGTTKLVCRGTSAYPEKGANFTLVASEDVAFDWDLWTTNYLVTADGVAEWCAVGSVKTLTPKVPGGKTFFRWTGDVTSAEADDNPLRLVVDGPKTVTSVSGAFVDSLADALDVPSLVFRTGGDGMWSAAVDALAGTGYTAASVTAAPESDVWFETTLEGTGALAFAWRTDCEHDDSGACEWDRLVVFVNGVEKARLDGTTDYQRVTLPLAGGKSVVRWSFYRDEHDEPGAPATPRAWVDGIRWMK